MKYLVMLLVLVVGVAEAKGEGRLEASEAEFKEYLLYLCVKEQLRRGIVPEDKIRPLCEEAIQKRGLGFKNEGFKVGSEMVFLLGLVVGGVLGFALGTYWGDFKIKLLRKGGKWLVKRAGAAWREERRQERDRIMGGQVLVTETEEEKKAQEEKVRETEQERKKHVKIGCVTVLLVLALLWLSLVIILLLSLFREGKPDVIVGILFIVSLVIVLLLARWLSRLKAGDVLVILTEIEEAKKAQEEKGRLDR